MMMIGLLFLAQIIVTIAAIAFAGKPSDNALPTADV